MRKKVRYGQIVLIFLTGILLYIAGNAISIWRFAGVDEACSSDVAIILGAGTYNNTLSPVFRERVNHGIWLYENDYVEKIIFTGGYGEGNEHSDAHVAKQYAVSKGVPEEDIFIEEESTITQENIKNAKSLMEEEGYDTALLVSDPLHMKRSMLMAEDFGMKVYSSPTPTTRYIGWKSKLEFLGREVFFYIGYKGYRILPENIKSHIMRR